MSEILNLPKGESLLPPEKIGKYFIVNPKNIENVVVDIGQPRISSTARAALVASGQGFDEVHFQPWKFAQRYSSQIEKNGGNPYVIINPSGKSRTILMKETPGGPNDRRELFDPVKILLEKGIPNEMIKVMLGIREPFAQFASWLKFDGTRDPEIYKDGQSFILSLFEGYQKNGIVVVPFVFELFNPNPQKYLEWIYDQLGIQVKLPENLQFAPNPPVIWHEANPQLDQIGGNDVGSSYFNIVVAPILNEGKYKIPNPKIPDLSLLEKYPQLIECARIYLQKAQEFYNMSIENGLPENQEFINFLTSYQNLIKNSNQ